MDYCITRQCRTTINHPDIRGANRCPTNRASWTTKPPPSPTACAATGAEDPFNETQRQESAQRRLSFRDAQLLKLHKEVLPPEDLDDAVTASDFTLYHFLSQLLRQLKRKREALEAMPAGVYAVAPADAAAVSVPPGVLFLLRQRHAAAADARQPAAGPGHPYLCHLHPASRQTRPQPTSPTPPPERKPAGYAPTGREISDCLKSRKPCRPSDFEMVA